MKFEITDPQTVVAERLRFITLPTEWTDAQFYAAAELTLQLQTEAVNAGFDLKDASAWNIIFDGTRPVFCDLLSFATLGDEKWWAAGQFARHFLIPLVVSRRRGLLAHQTFKIWRDGMPPEVGRRLLGSARFFSRHWPLTAGGNWENDSTAPSLPSEELRKQILSFRSRLQVSLSWMLQGAKPGKTQATASPWADYTENRSHYDFQAMTVKQQQMHGWLDRLRPEWVADLGCNTGEFSRIALEQGAKVVAVDSDHDSVERLFREESMSSDLYPVIATLDDLHGSRGWAGSEHTGLADRMENRFDLVMMLALLHHLSIAASIPLLEVARFAARCTRKWAIIEFIDETDPQLQLLCIHRQRTPGHFSARLQRAAFLDAGFMIEAECELAPSGRTLALLRRGV